MPTTKPRISITLEHADLAVVDRFAAAARTPRASVLAQLVSGCIPQLERAAKLMEAANVAPRQVLEEMREDLDAATDNVMASVEAVTEEYEGLLAGLSPVSTSRKPHVPAVRPGHGGARAQRVPPGSGRADRGSGTPTY